MLQPVLTVRCLNYKINFRTYFFQWQSFQGSTYFNYVYKIGEVEKELLRQQREEQAFMDGALVVSEEMSQDEFSTALRSNATSSVSSNSSSSSTPPGPVDIHGFMMEFIHKNYGELLCCFFCYT